MALSGTAGLRIAQTGGLVFVPTRFRPITLCGGARRFDGNIPSYFYFARTRRRARKNIYGGCSEQCERNCDILPRQHRRGGAYYSRMRIHRVIKRVHSELPAEKRSRSIGERCSTGIRGTGGVRIILDKTEIAERK